MAEEKRPADKQVPADQMEQRAGERPCERRGHRARGGCGERNWGQARPGEAAAAGQEGVTRRTDLWALIFECEWYGHGLSGSRWRRARRRGRVWPDLPTARVTAVLTDC
jgi:hypothetical protein